jgi:uncharacterized protein with PIN domain
MMTQSQDRKEKLHDILLSLMHIACVPRRAADPDLAVVCIRLRRSAVAAARKIAEREGTTYQAWVRDRVSEVVRERDGARLHVYKFLVENAAVVTVMAESLDAARQAAQIYGKVMEREQRLRPGALTNWLSAAEAREVPVREGVIAWAGF